MRESSLSAIYKWFRVKSHIEETNVLGGTKGVAKVNRSLTVVLIKCVKWRSFGVSNAQHMEIQYMTTQLPLMVEAQSVGIIPISYH